MAAGDGNGWVTCAAGHRHWGRFGAAGLLLRDGADVVLQHRSDWTHHGGTWGLPGGARDSHEDVVEAALREALEEGGIVAANVEPLAIYGDDHGGWSYTTVLARPRRTVVPVALNAESVELRWWPRRAVLRLPLHPGLAAEWPAVDTDPVPPRLIVDAANVVGSRPDGWWRDRVGATNRLLAALAGLARDGLVADGPGPVTPYQRLLPGLRVVVEGAARAAQAPVEGWWAPALSVVVATGSGDDTIVLEAQADPQAVVVTADRGLRARLPPTSPTRGPGWLWDQLTEAR